MELAMTYAKESKHKPHKASLKTANKYKESVEGQRIPGVEC